MLTIGAFIACGLTFQKHALELINWIDALGWYAPILFVVSYGFASLLFLPTLVLTLAGGALFGPFIGTILNLIGATTGAACSFLITRHVMYRWFSKQRGQGLTLLISEVNKKGWSVVAFLRLVPIVPFSLVNYSLGLTEIPFRLYLSATILFLIPAEIIYTYFGYAGRKALKNPDYLYQSGGLALLSTAAAFLLVLTWLKRRKLKKINAHSSTLFGT